VAAFIRDYRLALAQKLIMESDEKIIVIAMQFGYGHVNNFIAAYAKKFGESPGVARKSRN